VKVLLTGATGFVGSSVLPALLADGHAVTALVRSDISADTVTAAGATALRGDLRDCDLLTQAARSADAVIHLGSPGDETSGAIDDGVATAFLTGLQDSSKPYIHTGGAWIHGNTRGLVDEGAASDPPPIVAWRPPIEARIRAAASDGVRSVILCLGVVYGHGHGLPRLLVDGPRTDGPEPALLFPGTGEQHWTTVHVDDLAPLYTAALTRAAAGSYYHGVSGQNPTVRELAEAASRAAGLGGRVAPEAVEASRARLGLLEGAFALDQQATGTRARTELGWQPTGPSLLQEFETGSYAPRS
jgi:nucleoside-diphosphate-sugar epimerase